MQYREFLDHIYRKYSGNVKLELDRMVHLLEEMGQPQSRLRGFHVAGTNGKGSVCATLEALALGLGHHTGLNTSPHLIDYTERFRIDGKDLPFEQILNTFHNYEPLFEKWDASFFEITTAIAFAIFAREQVQTAVIEVGLGGRLDATNLWIPDVSAITTIGLDHVKTLGGTLELIAAEKAGIIKPEVPLVLGDIEVSPLNVILDAARVKGVEICRYGLEYRVENQLLSPSGLVFDYSFGDFRLKAVQTNLLGQHQANNVSTALTCFLLYLNKLGLKPDAEQIRKSLLRINWRGRMQLVHTSPTVIVDGAHNVQGITALVQSLDLIYPGKKPKFILSILADKNYSEMIRLICEHASLIYIAQNESDRAATTEEQAREVSKHRTPFKLATSVRDAYELALAEAEEDDLIIGGGSLYTVGEILSAAEKKA
ncbi:MAG TPA: folylpolyglutamate synthase/dihydrofolate synthase family protein [Candidatus Cloacimonadota bacterium]|nr:folylpolyglutamate synthase/dihydrofolate synthase family protein [Candidatus Cloacimonadota bacterium]